MESYSNLAIHVMESLDRLLTRRVRSPRFFASSGPVGFAAYADPLGRFTLSYPAEWTLTSGPSPTAASPLLKVFARVDLLRPGADPWREMARRLPELSWRPVSTARAEGGFKVRGHDYDWQASAFRGVVLSTGGLRGRADPLIQGYRRRILAVIRKRFRLGPGLRPS